MNLIIVKQRIKNTLWMTKIKTRLADKTESDAKFNVIKQ